MLLRPRAYQVNVVKRLTLAIVLILTGCVPIYHPAFLLESGELTYPEAVKKANIEGWVVVQYGINLEGRVCNLKVVNADPALMFERMVLEYVSTWRFQPAIRNGVPETSEGLISRIALTLSKDE